METQSQQLPVETDATSPLDVMDFLSRRASEDDVEPAPATEGLPEPDGTKSPAEQVVDVSEDLKVILLLVSMILRMQESKPTKMSW